MAPDQISGGAIPRRSDSVSSSCSSARSVFTVIFLRAYVADMQRPPETRAQADFPKLLASLGFAAFLVGCVAQSVPMVFQKQLAIVVEPNRSVARPEISTYPQGKTSKVGEKYVVTENVTLVVNLAAAETQVKQLATQTTDL